MSVLIEKQITSFDEPIEAAVTFPLPDLGASVRVAVRLIVAPHDLVRTTDARIIAEAYKILATMSGTNTGSETPTGLYEGVETSDAFAALARRVAALEAGSASAPAGAGTQAPPSASSLYDSVT